MIVEPKPRLEAPALLSNDEFERVCALIRRHAGIVLSQSRHAMVLGRLGRRLRATGHRDFSRYLNEVERTGSAELQSFINSLTTNLTAFFREDYHFPVLAAHLRRSAAGAEPGDAAARAPHSVWCCAASTGEEAYSIAIAALEALGPSTRCRVLASDIDTDALERARAATYPLESVAQIDAARRRAFFERGVRSNAGMVRVRPQVRALVQFERINLVDEHWPLDSPFDAIFCRNAMIYLDAAVCARLLERLHRALRPGGLLFLGHAESAAASPDLFIAEGRTVFRRTP